MSARSDGQHSECEEAPKDQSPATLPVPHLTTWQLGVKRTIDIIVSLIAMLVFLPLTALVAIAIKLDSKGPVFFAQPRVGQGGRLFTLFKFRSMYRDADQMKQSLGHMNEAEGPIFKIKRDPRITKVGAFLRKTSLDELPQFINVLKGEMSLVGPRPPLPIEVEKYTDYQRGRLAARPGLTCLWQVQGRSSVSFERWVELDLEYIRNQSIWLDIKILLKTIPAVLKGTGAW